MGSKNAKIDTKIVLEETVKMLNSRGIQLKDIAEIVVEIQKKYIPDITVDLALFNVERVLDKREVCYAILTGLAIDQLAEQNLLPYPLQQIVESDESLYGIDEVIAVAIANIYGSIGWTNFGYLDKEKIGIILELDTKDGEVHTFADDIVAAIAAAAASRTAHHQRDILEKD